MAAPVGPLAWRRTAHPSRAGSRSRVSARPAASSAQRGAAAAANARWRLSNGGARRTRQTRQKHKAARRTQARERAMATPALRGARACAPAAAQPASSRQSPLRAHRRRHFRRRCRHSSMRAAVSAGASRPVPARPRACAAASPAHPRSHSRPDAHNAASPDTPRVLTQEDSRASWHESEKGPGTTPLSPRTISAIRAKDLPCSPFACTRAHEDAVHACS
eukprot:4070572-Pleurochrysis_carterae.AAC.3